MKVKNKMGAADKVNEASCTDKRSRRDRPTEIEKKIYKKIARIMDHFTFFCR